MTLFTNEIDKVLVRVSSRERAHDPQAALADAIRESQRKEQLEKQLNKEPTTSI